MTPIGIFGSPVDRRALEQLKRVMADERVVAGALMADHHVGYSMPIGGVVVYDGAVSPSGVGFDIACGNKAVRTKVHLDEIAGADDVLDLMKEVGRKVAFGMGRVNTTPVDHELFDDPLWPELEELLPGIRELARQQLGTVGAGNHYVDLLVDDSDGSVWIANHFGSRGFGHKIASAFLNLEHGLDPTARVRDQETPTVFDLGSALGDLYFSAMQLAGRYAYAGRDFVIDQVLAILQTETTCDVHNHHNYAWRNLETGHVVVRKGATPLTDAPAFIGGSMGDNSAIVHGTGYDLGNLGSAPHGAGRVMSRTQAAGKYVKKSVERTGPDGQTYQKKIRVRDAATGAVDWPAVQRRLDRDGIAVIGGGADEAPEVYKRLDHVLAQHENIVVTNLLRPIGVVMAGPDEYDPYKD